MEYCTTDETRPIHPTHALYYLKRPCKPDRACKGRPAAAPQIPMIRVTHPKSLLDNQRLFPAPLPEIRRWTLTTCPLPPVRWGVRPFPQKPQIEKSESLKTYHAYEIHAHEVHTQ
jgi:hypothetical protein